MSLLRGVGSLHPRGAALGACKALRRSVGDSPGQAFATIALAARVAPFALADWLQQKIPKVDPSNNSYGHNRASFKEEVTMIDSGKLPPSCKELASASVHFAPHGFHKEL